MERKEWCGSDRNKKWAFIRFSEGPKEMKILQEWGLLCAGIPYPVCPRVTWTGICVPLRAVRDHRFKPQRVHIKMQSLGASPPPLVFWTRVPGMSGCGRQKSSRFTFLTSSLCVLYTLTFENYWTREDWTLPFLSAPGIGLSGPHCPPPPYSPSWDVCKYFTTCVTAAARKQDGWAWLLRSHMRLFLFISAPSVPHPPPPYTPQWWKYSQSLVVFWHNYRCVREKPIEQQLSTWVTDDGPLCSVTLRHVPVE